MTPAEKAKRTRTINKLWRAHEERTEQHLQNFYAFCETLYPKRDAALAEIDAEYDRVITEALAKRNAAYKKIMDQFETSIEAKKLTYDEINESSYKVYLHELREAGL